MTIDNYAELILLRWDERRPFGIIDDTVIDTLYSWSDTPIRESDPPKHMSARPSERGIATKSDLARFIYEEFGMLDSFIERADSVECLTSPYKYIRECKKWYMKKGAIYEHGRGHWQNAADE